MTKLQIIEIAITALLYLIVRILTSRMVDKIVVNRKTIKTKGKIIKKAINITMLSVFITIILSILGVNQSELAVFIGSVLTVIGIALFAQWSILSNITSGIIIFFNHSVQIDDTIMILDKDYEIEGRISDIGLFFVILKTKEGDRITIPNSVFLNKTIKNKTNA